MKTTFKRIVKAIDYAVDNLMFVAMLGMVILVALNVVLRYIFNSGLPVSEEISRYLFVWVVFLGAISALKEGKHVGVDVLVSRLKGKPKFLILALGYVLIIVACGIMLVGGWAFTKLSFVSKGPASGIPFAYVSISYVIAALCMGAIIISRLYKLVRKGELE